jgi:hypothetical protein
MKSLTVFACVSLLAFGCAWRFAGDEVAKSEQFLVTFGDKKPAGRLRATADGVVLELFENSGDPIFKNEKQTSRASLGLDESGVSSLTLRDGKGRPRFRVTTEEDGATSLGITDNQGKPIWGVDVDARGRVKVRSRVGLTPAQQG